MWHGLGSGSRQLIQFGATIALARLLTPGDFGIIGMVTVVTAFLVIFADMGMSVALVQHRDPTDRQFDAAFWLLLGAGAVLTLTMWVTAPLVVAIYDEPALEPLVRLAGFQFLISAVGSVPRIMLIRQLRFRALALVDISSGVTAALVGVGAAVAGGGAASLVLMLLASSATQSLLCSVVVGWRPGPPASVRELKSTASFARNLVAFRVVNFWARSGDDLLVGRFLGSGALGLYTLAYQLVMMPLQQIATVIGDVMLPVMSNCRDDKAQVRFAFLRAVQATALLLAPIMLGLIIVAPEAVSVMFGEQWRAAVPVTRILALAGAVQVLGVTVGWIYQSQGRSDLMFRWGTFAAAVALAAVIAGLPWGITGVAGAYAMAVLVLTPLSLHLAGRVIDLSITAIAVEMRPVLGACAVMVAAALGVRLLARIIDAPDAVVLTATVCAGAAAYALAVLRKDPDSLDVMRPLLYGLRRR